MRRLVVDTLWVLAARLVMRGANVLALALLARTLPLAEFGFYGFLVATTLILSVALDLGVRQSGAYAIGQGSLAAGTVVTTAMAFLVPAAALSALATYVACLWAGYDLPPHLLWLAAAITPPQLVMRTLQGPLLGLRRVAELNVGELVVRAVLLLVTVPAFFLGRLDLALALLTLTLAQWAGCVVLILQLAWRIRPLPLPNPAIAWQLIKGGLPFLSGIVGVILFGRIGIWAITSVGSPELVGRYVGTLRMTEILAELATAVGVAVFAHGVQQAGARQSALDTVRLVRLLTLAIAAGAVLIAIVPGLVLHLLLGPAFAAEGDTLRLMLPGAVLGCQAAMLFPGLSARGQARLGLVIFGPGTLVHGLLVWLLTPVWGIAGAALAYTLGQATVALAVLVAWHRLFEIGWRELLLPGTADLRKLAGLLRRRPG